jgi:hypothetical protein
MRSSAPPARLTCHFSPWSACFSGVTRWQPRASGQTPKSFLMLRHDRYRTPGPLAQDWVSKFWNLYEQPRVELQARAAEVARAGGRDRPLRGVQEGVADVASTHRSCGRSLPPDHPGQPSTTETRRNLSQQVKGRRDRAIDQAWAHRMLLLRGGDNLSCRASLRLQEVFTADDPTGALGESPPYPRGHRRPTPAIVSAVHAGNRGQLVNCQKVASSDCRCNLQDVLLHVIEDRSAVLRPWTASMPE